MTMWRLNCAKFKKFVVWICRKSLRSYFIRETMKFYSIEFIRTNQGCWQNPRPNDQYQYKNAIDNRPNLINIYFASSVNVTKMTCINIYQLAVMLSFLGYPVRFDQVPRSNSGMWMKECSFSFDRWKSIAFCEHRI